MDFTKLENIIFTAVAGAVALFLFIMAFYVISKGRRKTSGLDIFLRIMSVLVLLVSAGMFVLALFTGFTGDLRIEAAGDKAVFVAGNSLTELPLGALFVTLSTSTGQIIVIVLFVIAFMTLVADCLLAKKKYGKKAAKTEKANKTPEELKREAELEKIRKLSDAAVKKSNSAADKVSATDKKDREEEPENTIEQERKPEEEEPAFDWRVDAPQKKGFVGLSNSSSNEDFDSFDDFDQSEESTEELKEETIDEFTEEITEENEQNIRQDEYDDFAVEDQPVYDDEQEPVEEQEQIEEQEQFEAQEVYDQEVEESTEEEKPWYEQDNPADERIIAEALADDTPAPVAQPAEQPEAQTVEEEPEAQDDLRDIAPNRNIYIPGIRTVSRTPRDAAKRAERPAERPAPSAPQASAAKPTPAAKPVAKKPARTSASQKPVTPAAKPATKPAAKPAQKKPTQKKPVAKPAAKPASKKAESKAIDPAKLPITRRYVILDRRNAVNIFNNYLKEREQAGKDKLESSINTIIIK